MKVSKETSVTEVANCSVIVKELLESDYKVLMFTFSYPKKTTTLITTRHNVLG